MSLYMHALHVVVNKSVCQQVIKWLVLEFLLQAPNKKDTCQDKTFDHLFGSGCIGTINQNVKSKLSLECDCCFSFESKPVLTKKCNISTVSLYVQSSIFPAVLPAGRKRKWKSILSWQYCVIRAHVLYGITPHLMASFIAGAAHAESPRTN